MVQRARYQSTICQAASVLATGWLVSSRQVIGSLAWGGSGSLNSPIMAGGVGEGAIPLSIGYAQILHQSQGDLFAQVLPPVMLGSLTAILLAGTLNYVGKRFLRLTGEGHLQPGGHDELLREGKIAALQCDPEEEPQGTGSGVLSGIGGQVPATASGET